MSVSPVVVCLAGLGARAGADERGASAAEYAILVGFIAAVIVGAVAMFGTSVAGLFGIDLIP